MLPFTIPAGIFFNTLTLIWFSEINKGDRGAVEKVGFHAQLQPSSIISGIPSEYWVPNMEFAPIIGHYDTDMAPYQEYEEYYAT